MTETNGNGSKFLQRLKHDWFLILFVIGLAFATGQISARVQIATANESQLADRSDRLEESLERHQGLPGHPHVIARMANVEQLLEEVRSDVKELLRVSK